MSNKPFRCQPTQASQLSACPEQTLLTATAGPAVTLSTGL